MDVQKYRLSQHAFLCIARRYCVVLDARRDRYLAIKSDMMESLGPWLDGWIGQSTGAVGKTCSDSSICELASNLCRREILTRSTETGKPVQPQMIPAATQSAPVGLHKVRGTELMRHAFNFLKAVGHTRHLFRTGSFEAIAFEITKPREGRDNNVTPDYDYEEYLVSVFKRCRPLYSRPVVCLFDSICLLNFLALYRFYPALVFAVIAEPFQAHCWLQEGQSVLNDSLEHAGAYTPIMLI
jgi:hypothetical protein